MGTNIRNILVIGCIIVIASAIGASLRFGFQYGIFESAISALTTFSVLLILYNNFFVLRHIHRVERSMRDIHTFEQEIIKRTLKVEKFQNNHIAHLQVSETDQTPDKSANVSDNPLRELPGTNQKTNGLLSELGERTRNSVKTEESNANQLGKFDNIISLRSRSGNFIRPISNQSIKIKPSQLSKALERGGTELYLQPVLEIPSRNIRFFEAFFRIRIGDNVLTSKQFLPAAKNAGQIARIDLLSLEMTLKVVRSLQRQNNDYPVFWNIAPQTLGSKKIFEEIIEYLRANQPLNSQLIFAVYYDDYLNFNRVQTNNLARIRDLGFELALGKVSRDRCTGSNLEALFANGIFSVIKISAKELMGIDKDEITNFAERIVPIAMEKNILLIASEIENDTQTLSMIDADIFLAQGDGLMPAKALRKELGGH